MMYLCTSRFDIESDQHTFIEEYLTAQEIQAEKEKRKSERLDDDMFAYGLGSHRARCGEVVVNR
jgi:hypothetical protein